jgi:multisubunit Na+/H+ antiporter MnhB subunit
MRLSLLSLTAAGLAAALAIVLVGAMLELPRDPAGLTELVDAHLDQAGAAHPVTAVLLDFRAYDTWLEIGVLMLAVLGALALRRRTDLGDVSPLPEAGPILSGVTRVLVPVMVLVAGYLLWLGTHAPGGAFQAGAVLAAAAILLLMAGGRSITLLRGRLLPAVLAVGFAAFLLVAVSTLVLGRALLDYPPGVAGAVILIVEVAVTITIAVGLAGLFAAARRGGADT